MQPFEVIERPAARRGGKTPHPITLGLIQTVDSGKALRVPLDGQRLDSVRNRCMAAMKARGFILHTFLDGDALVMWAERKEPRNASDR